MCIKILQRIEQNGEALKHLIDPVQFLSVVEEAGAQEDITTTFLASLFCHPSIATDVLIASSNSVTPFRLAVIGYAARTHPDIAAAVLPLLHHHLDDPVVTVRRLASEIIKQLSV